jgi:hypothetical protein
MLSQQFFLIIIIKWSKNLKKWIVQLGEMVGPESDFSLFCHKVKFLNNYFVIFTKKSKLTTAMFRNKN